MQAHLHAPKFQRNDQDGTRAERWRLSTQMVAMICVLIQGGGKAMFTLTENTGYV